LTLRIAFDYTRRGLGNRRRISGCQVLPVSATIKETNNVDLRCISKSQLFEAIRKRLRPSHRVSLQARRTCRLSVESLEQRRLLAVGTLIGNGLAGSVGYQAGTVTLDVQITSNAQQVNSLDWGITYDPAQLTIQADTQNVGAFGGDVVNLAADLSPTWLGACNTTIPGEIFVTMSASDGSYFQSDTVDVLRLTFHVNSSALTGSTPLAFDMDNSSFNGGGSDTPVLTPVDSSIHIVPAPVFSNLSAPTISYGTAFTDLSGTIVAGASVPSGNVSITLNGETESAPIDPATGNFHHAFDTHALQVTQPYGITYTYSDAGLPAPVTDTSNSLTVTPLGISGAFTASNKVYDGSNMATIASRTLSGVLGSDDVQLVGGTAAFAGSHVGNGIAVTAIGLTLSGLAASNYTLLNPTETTTASITPATLTWDGVSSGNWTNGQWIGANLTYPDSGVAAIVNTPKVVQVTSSQSAYSLEISNGGQVAVAGGVGLSVVADASVTGNGTLSVDGNGSLTVGGTLTLDSGGNLSGGSLVAAVYQFDAGTASADLSGPGGLIKGTSGTLVLSGSNSYKGGTVVAAGTLIIAKESAILDGTSLAVGNSTLFNSILDLPATTLLSANAASIVSPASTSILGPATLTSEPIAATLPSSASQSFVNRPWAATLALADEVSPAGSVEKDILGRSESRQTVSRAEAVRAVVRESQGRPLPGFALRTSFAADSSGQDRMAPKAVDVALRFWSMKPGRP
jgi:autotransporter-associated beta strand protein